MNEIELKSYKCADIGLLKTAIPYIRAYKGRIFVIKLAGSLCEDETGLLNLAEQLGVLYQVGIKLVVIHGGGNQATSLGERLGIDFQFINGRRVTSDEMLEVAKMSFAGTVNTNLIAAFRPFGVPAVGVSGIDGNLLTAQKRPKSMLTDSETGENREVDFGNVGDIVDSNVKVLHQLLNGDYAPVICSLAADKEGKVLNVNADTMASKIAADLGASKYILLTNVNGVMKDLNDPDSLFSLLDLNEIQQLIDNGTIKKGMLPKLGASLDALKNGVPRVHIVNGLSPDALLREVFTNVGCGTLIVKDKSELETKVAATAS